MSDVKPIPKEDLPQFVDIVASAYPAMELESADGRYRALHNLEQGYIDERRDLFGLYRDGSLLGGMYLYDFEMSVRNEIVDTGGVGLVAVHLLHKKEKVAKELIDFFLDHYRKKRAPLVSLYPFRPDFYKKMGFGFGPKISQYRVLPSALPRGHSRKNIRYMVESDAPILMNCYNNYARKTHGMILRNLGEIERHLFGTDGKVIGFVEEGEVKGYLSFSFKKGASFLENDLSVQEIVFQTPRTLAQLMTFLHTQLDQARRVVINTHDSEMHHLFIDPRNDSGNLIPFVNHETNTQGMGLMYRIIDIPLIFSLLPKYNFGGQTITLGINISDSFFPDNQGSYVVDFVGGYAASSTGKSTQAHITMDIADFSALFMGTVSFRGQYQFGLAEISDPQYVPVIEKLFKVEHPPVCMTQF